MNEEIGEMTWNEGRFEDRDRNHDTQCADEVPNAEV